MRIVCTKSSLWFGILNLHCFARVLLQESYELMLHEGKLTDHRKMVVN